MMKNQGLFVKRLPIESWKDENSEWRNKLKKRIYGRKNNKEPKSNG